MSMVAAFAAVAAVQGFGGCARRLEGHAKNLEVKWNECHGLSRRLAKPSKMARHPLIELTLARFREFLREPEAVFWSFAFPIIMTCALGVAFRSSADAAGHRRRRADARRATPSPMRLERAGWLYRAAIAPDEIERAVRDGRAAVVVKPGRRRSITSTRRAPKARRRASPWTRRCSARPADRTSFVAERRPVDARRFALHRLARAGAARDGHHEHRLCGRSASRS